MYRRSNTGKLYKRKEKHPIPCPVCNVSTQWATRHLLQVHNIGKSDAIILLRRVDGYRRRKAVDNPKPKEACIIPGCTAFIVCLKDHLRRVHKTSIRNFKREAAFVPAFIACDGSSAASTANITHCPSLETDMPATSTRQELFFVGVDEATGQSIYSVSEESELRCRSVPYILTKFGEHMASMDGGCKAKPDMYVLGARQVLEAVGGNLACLTKEAVMIKYVEPLKTKIGSAHAKLSIKTVRNKLKFLEYFCEFLMSDDCRNSVEKEWCGELARLVKALPGWRAALRGQCSMEEVRRRVLDGQEALTKVDIDNYRKSEYAAIAGKLMLSMLMNPNSVPSVSDFHRCRNHLLALFSVSNAHRTGVLCNFSVSDYEQGLKAQKVPATDIAFTVVEHKTATSHGEAVLAVNPEEAKLLAGYMIMRANLKTFGPAAPFVFINTTGSKMSQSNIGSSLTNAFQNSGYQERVNCTKLRKTVVTEIHKNHPDKKGPVAAHMCHREATAEKYYKIYEKQKNTFDSVQLLRNAFAEVPDKCLSAVDDSVPINPSRVSSICKTTSVLDGESEFSDDDSDLIPDTDIEMAESDVELAEDLKKGGRLWSDKHSRDVQRLFSDFIDKHSAPLLDIDQRLDCLPLFKAEWSRALNRSGHALTRCVRDKVRSYYRFIYGYKNDSRPKNRGALKMKSYRHRK